MSNLYGVSAYQQTNGVWNNKTNSTKNEKTTSTKNTDSTTGKSDDVKITEFKPIDTKSSLVPTTKPGYGTVIGNVELSDKAKDYYGKLKSKFGNMEFILVSEDMKSQVQANAAAYGNANKQVVLINAEKLEMMANDESYRKKYEEIIAMSQLKLQEAKNSLTSSGASLKNFGMSVDSNGKATFFATVEKANKKAAEKKQAAKKAAKAKEKKRAEDKAKEKKLEEKRAKEKAEEKDADEISNESDDKDYVVITANSMEELIDKVSSYAFNHSSILSEDEKKVGQNFDFRG
ncbi:MAG: hypothetical protein HDT40_03380 [Lachnospiraceae bacterium]|nr:hypothetical protein [Lachnospiraceae bacterium]